MLMSPNKGETAVRGCHCPGNMAVRMRELLVRPWVGVCVPLALSFLQKICKSKVYMKHYPNVILRNIMVFSAMVYLDSKRAYRPTSPHSPNQQIHAYKNSNVNKICVADIRFFSSVEIWRLFLFDSPFSHCPYAPTILFSSLPHPLPPSPR